MMDEGTTMDEARARELLANERSRLERLLRAEIAATAPDQGDEVDDANWRIAEETGRAVSRSLRDRWSALERAEDRLARGTYGRSVLSAKPIPDERMEADPLAELTVEEAASEAIRARFSPEPVSGLSSTRRTLAALVERDDSADEEVVAAEPAGDDEDAEEVDAVVADADLEVDGLEDEELIPEEAFEGEDEEEPEEPEEPDDSDDRARAEDDGEAEAVEQRPRRGRRGR
jgi:DnaK suppressor protein